MHGELGRADRLERILLLRCNKNFSASPNFHPHLLNSLLAISIMSMYIHSLYLSVESLLYIHCMTLVSSKGITIKPRLNTCKPMTNSACGVIYAANTVK